MPVPPEPPRISAKDFDAWASRGAGVLPIRIFRKCKDETGAGPEIARRLRKADYLNHSDHTVSTLV